MSFLGDKCVQEYIFKLEKFSLRDFATEKWWILGDYVQQLSLQSLSEIGNKLEESVKTYLIEHGKITVLVHEAILMSIWRQKIFPDLTTALKTEPSKSFLLYMMVYHETTVVTFLEAVLYHAGTCSELGDTAVDLVDYCAELITATSLVESHPSLAEDGTHDIMSQEKELTFGVGMKCIALVLYLSEHMERLPLSAIARLYRTHDLPMLLVHLIERAPWMMEKNSKMHSYNDGTWQESTGKNKTVCKAEAQTWLALHQLLLFPELGKFYQMTEFARNKLSMLEGKINAPLLNLLPPLSQLKEALVRLATFQLPPQKPHLILEVIPEIKNSILAEGQEMGWKELMDIQTERLTSCSAQQVATLAERMCKTLASVPSHRKCQNCNLVANSRCSKCKRTWYCGRQCQVAHYPVHKNDCRSEYAV